MSARREIPAGEFKTHCLQLLDQVEQGREELIVTKRGRPVAKVVPIDAKAKTVRGSVKMHGDIVAPIDESWEAER